MFYQESTKVIFEIVDSAHKEIVPVCRIEFFFSEVDICRFRWVFVHIVLKMGIYSAISNICVCACTRNFFSNKIS